MASLQPGPDEALLEAIVSLAGYDSTTFLDIFKAYNAVLEANGLDPADDVQFVLPFPPPSSTLSQVRGADLVGYITDTTASF